MLRAAPRWEDMPCRRIRQEGRVLPYLTDCIPMVLPYGLYPDGMGCVPRGGHALSIMRHVEGMSPRTLRVASRRYGLRPDFARAVSRFLMGNVLVCRLCPDMRSPVILRASTLRWQWLCLHAAPQPRMRCVNHRLLVWAHPRSSSSAGFGGVGAASAPALDLRPKRLAVLRPAFAHTRTTTGGPIALWHEATAQDCYVSRSA
jgi:hypothetical protein